jgi:hypothetical protein
MRTDLVMGVLLLGSVAAVAFEIGRDSQACEPEIRHAPAYSETTSPSPPLIQNKPINVADLSHLRFPGAYAWLKRATPEELSACLEKLSAVKASPSRWNAIASFFKTMVQIDPATATKLVARLAPRDHFIAMIAMKDAAPPRAMPQIVDLLRTFPMMEISDCSFDYLHEAVEQWSAFDPVAVSVYLDQHPKDENLSRYFATVVENWAAYDPDAARAWADRHLTKSGEENPNGVDSPNPPSELTEAWVKGYLRHDRAAALDYVVRLQNADGVKDAIPNVAEVLFRDSPAEAIGFVQRLTEESQAKALRGIAWAAERKLGSDADAWKRSPEYVANWMLQFPEPAWRGAMGQVITEWRYGDAPKLFTWMSRLPPGTREKVGATYVPYLPPEIVEKEFAMVMQLADVELRDQLLGNFMAAAQDSRELAMRCLAQSDLSGDQQQRLAKRIPKREYEILPEPEDGE